MGVDTAKTLLPLYRFAQLTGMDPLHFSQVTFDADTNNDGCGDVLMQHSWQNGGRLGRDEIALLIASCEDELAELLGYKLLPTWEVERNVPYRSTVLLDTNYQWPSVRTRWKHIQYGGHEAKTLIANAAITYTDNDGDGYFETATITTATTVTDSEEIALYYPGKLAVDSWEIRPINVSIASGIATITCRRELLVLESKLEAYGARSVQGTDSLAFLSNIDVYRHYNDASYMARFLWEPVPIWCGCSTCACTDPAGTNSSCAEGCAVGYQDGCLAIRNAEAGLVYIQPGTYDASSNGYTPTSNYLPLNGFYGTPDRAHLWYRAGWRDLSLTNSFSKMSPKWERALTNLVLARLERPICECPAFESQYSYYSTDQALIQSEGGASSSYQLGKRIIDCPLGRRIGEVYAWNLVVKEQLGDAVYV